MEERESTCTDCKNLCRQQKRTRIMVKSALFVKCLVTGEVFSNKLGIKVYECSHKEAKK
jgi:hypothetical protein